MLSAQKETPFAGRKPGGATSGGVPEANVPMILYGISAGLSRTFSFFLGDFHDSALC